MNYSNWFEIFLLLLGLILFAITVFEQIRGYRRKKRRGEIAKRRGGGV